MLRADPCPSISRRRTAPWARITRHPAQLASRPRSHRAKQHGYVRHGNQHTATLPAGARSVREGGYCRLANAVQLRASAWEQGFERVPLSRIDGQAILHSATSTRSGSNPSWRRLCTPSSLGTAGSGRSPSAAPSMARLRRQGARGSRATKGIAGHPVGERGCPVPTNKSTSKSGIAIAGHTVVSRHTRRSNSEQCGSRCSAPLPISQIHIPASKHPLNPLTPGLLGPYIRGYTDHPCKLDQSFILASCVGRASNDVSEVIPIVTCCFDQLRKVAPPVRDDLKTRSVGSNGGKDLSRNISTSAIEIPVINHHVNKETKSWTINRHTPYTVGFAVAMFLRVHVGSRAERHEPAPAPARLSTGSRSTGTGRAVLVTMRTINDVRVLSRGPGAYGKRVLRRSAFRAIRKW